MTRELLLLYNIRMQNENTDPCDDRKLTCQVNVRMTPEMRDHLEAVAKDNWTSASQIARLDSDDKEERYVH